MGMVRKRFSARTVGRECYFSSVKTCLADRLMVYIIPTAYILVYDGFYADEYGVIKDAMVEARRRQKLSATPDLSGTVLPYVLFRTQR